MKVAQTHFLNKFTIWVTIFCAILLLTGCEQDAFQSIDQLRSPPIGSFLRGTSEKKIVRELRNYLSLAAEKYPDESVLSMIYFKEPITLDKYQEIVSNFDLQGGFKAAFQIEVPGFMISNQMFPEGTTLPLADEFQRFVEDARRSSPQPVPPGSTILFHGMRVYSSPKNLQKLWDERDDIIRAIGIMNRASDSPQLMGWKNIQPSGPLQ